MANNRVGEETKRILCESLKKKMRRKPIDKITIRELVEDCGMNRQTFYYHFEDIYDLLRWMYEQEVFTLLRERANAENWQVALLQSLRYLEDNKAVTLNAIQSVGHEHITRFFFNDLNDIVVRILDSYRDVLESYQALKPGSDAGLPVDFEEMFVYYITISLSALAEAWVRGDVKKTPEEIVEFAEIVVHDQLLGLAARLSGAGENYGS